ncbi:hypothetical protein MDAP_001931 [Mitosporidium daphniae]|uniref:Uncharacterized protein n=1 Tax=Mitosporidium daphniae TaxID=1485682 RepID=A0A098VR81_9MICR|nr:uncharacterized protein DI09_32p220 [Mitosporidium daphniae]KGG51537.1 hypothetical protein DI09_32p220 [Mitosporidium daphniae]|eukprot:XP_013237964.1 uncharacterized protein DI09_32p220 [Mitosporidium daphniae]
MAISPILIFQYVKAKCRKVFSKGTVSDVSEAISSSFPTFEVAQSKEGTRLVFDYDPRRFTSSSIVAMLLPNSREKRLAVYISLALIFIFIAFLLHFTLIVVGLGLAYKSYVFSFHPQLLNITYLDSLSMPVHFEAHAISVSFVDILFKKFTVDVFAANDTDLEYPILSHTLNNLCFYGSRKKNHIVCDIGVNLTDRFPFIDFSKNYEFLVRYSFQWDLSCAWIPSSISHFILTKETLYAPAEIFTIEHGSAGDVILVAKDPPPEVENESSGDWEFDTASYSLIFIANRLSYDAQYGIFTLDTFTVYAEQSSIILDIQLLYKHNLEYLAVSFPESKFVISVKSGEEHIDDQLIGYGKIDPININPNDRPSRVRFTIEVPFEHNGKRVNGTFELGNGSSNSSTIPGLSMEEFERFLYSTKVNQHPSWNSGNITDVKPLKEITGTPGKIQNILRNYLTRKSPILLNLLFKDVGDNIFEKWVNNQGGVRIKLKGSSSTSPHFQFYISLIVVFGHIFDLYIDASHFILFLKHILRV